MMNERKALAGLFRRYGFSEGYSSNPLSHAVFVIRSGYFHQAEIIVLDSHDEAGVDATQKALTQTGYACSVRSYRGLEDLDSRLFAGFFGVDDARLRHEHHYKQYVERVARTVGGSYSYISAPFSRDDAEISDGSPVDEILAALNDTAPTLVLIEAAAGFGKTCTAYEVLNELVKRRPDRPPLFVELARNRQAPLFRYVLLDEIDRHYPSLNSELVTAEIRSGKVPLIVDGFDELLRRSMDRDTDLEDGTKLESMLDTIAELLTGSAKIVLTTRKTAIFSASTFLDWTTKRQASFKTTRIVLREPALKHWLGPDRAAQIDQLGSIATSLANPVLLSFLRNADSAEFEAYVQDTDALVDRYFSSLLERELERQDINIGLEDQLSIYRDLAASMVLLDITCEARSVVATLIRERSRAILEDSLKRYSPAARPTIDELSEKLAGHALLDRIGGDSDQVGFVNDFIAGTLFADSLQANRDLFCSEKVLDLATWAYSVRGLAARQQLHSSIAQLRAALLPLERLTVDLRLLKRLDEPLSNLTIDGVLFEFMTLGVPHGIEACTFVGCTFRSVRFIGETLSVVGFLSCRFYDCFVDGAATGSWQTGSEAFPDSALLDRLVTEPIGQETVGSPSVEVEVLRQFWPIGRANASDRLSTRTVYRGFEQTRRGSVSEALSTLQRAGLLTVHTDHGGVVRLNLEKIGEIRERLGR